MGDIREVRYLTDDRDEKRRNELVITLGGNGDWYVSVVPEGQKTIGRGVRVSTSGGASRRAPGLPAAIAEAFKALTDAQEAEQRDRDQDPACDISGRCVAPKGAKGITNCLYCGKELRQGADGKWYTWDADMFEGQDLAPQDEE
jgi:hypothetical protein